MARELVTEASWLEMCASAVAVLLLLSFVYVPVLGAKVYCRVIAISATEGPIFERTGTKADTCVKKESKKKSTLSSVVPVECVGRRWQESRLLERRVLIVTQMFDRRCMDGSEECCLVRPKSAKLMRVMCHYTRCRVVVAFLGEVAKHTVNRLCEAIVTFGSEHDGLELRGFQYIVERVNVLAGARLEVEDHLFNDFTLERCLSNVNETSVGVREACLEEDDFVPRAMRLRSECLVCVRVVEFEDSTDHFLEVLQCECFQKSAVVGLLADADNVVIAVCRDSDVVAQDRANSGARRQLEVRNTDRPECRLDDDRVADGVDDSRQRVARWIATARVDLVHGQDDAWVDDSTDDAFAGGAHCCGEMSVVRGVRH